MALLKSSKLTKADTSNILKKAKTTTKQAPKVKKGISQSISQMVDNAERKLGKYKDKYQLIRNEQDLKQYIEKCTGDIYASIDTETTGLNCFTDKVVGVCLYSESNKPCYIPLRHKSYITGVLSPEQLEDEHIKQYLSNCNKIKWIMHNADFDIRFMRHTFGVYLKCYWDTLIAARLLDENAGDNSLKGLHLKFCNSEDNEALSFDKLFKGVTFDNIPIQTAYLYAAGDPLKTFELYKYQKAQFEKPGMENLYKVFLEIEMPIVEVVADMEDTGVAIDFEIANKLSEKYNAKKAEVVEKANSILLKYQEKIENYKLKNVNHKLGTPINLKSPAQLAILFYDILKLAPIPKQSARGTGVEILREFAKGEHKELCECILELRGVEKLLDTYIEKMPELAKRDGRIHCRFNQLGAGTGRFSSDSPNLQNIPSRNKEIRYMFKATEGHELISCDYSKQEVFIAASVSGDEDFIQSCKNSLINDTDIYSEIAAMIYNLPYEDCVEFRKDGSTNKDGKVRRGNAKNIVLAILYSKGVNSIATDLNVTKNKAQAIYNGVLKAFPKLKDTIQHSQDHARQFGYVETAWGRRRRLPDMQLEPYEFKLKDGVAYGFDPLDFDNNVSYEVPQSTKDNYVRRLDKAYGFKAKNTIKQEALQKGIAIKDNGGFIAQAERQCLNSRIQGSAGDITKVAMILIHKDKILKDLGLKLLITIHDELIAEAPKENIKKASERMAELMIEAGKEKIKVPMKVDIDITTNWNMKRGT